MSARRRGARLTREGWILAVLTVGVGIAGVVSGNNVLILVVSGLVAVWIVDAVLGPWNLRQLEVRRDLPGELFAEQAGRGSFRVRNRRRWLPSVAVHVSEDRGGGAEGWLHRLGPGEEVHVPAGWHFPGRGPAALGRIRLQTGFPFGLWTRWREHERTAEVLVYPRPRPAEPRVKPGAAGAEGPQAAGRGAIGDLDGLREYREGDAPRRIHWPTSARVGVPVIMQRTDEQADRVTVQVRNLHGRAWEHELSRACGEVLRAFHRGCRVGLELPDGRFEARGGPAWRRTLLEILARQPDRGA